MALHWLCLLTVGACSDGPPARPTDSGPDARPDLRADGGVQSTPIRDAQAPDTSSDATGRAEAGMRNDAGDPVAPLDAADMDAGSLDAATPKARPLLANAGVQLLVTGSRLGLQLTAANIADDSDVVAVHFEFDGVPWNELEAGQEPLAEWTARVHELASMVKALDRPVFLSISMLNGSRRSLAPRALIKSGKLETEDNWAANCYDFASAADAQAKRAAYLRYEQLMIAAFAPRWLNYAIELNLYFEACPAGVPGLVALANQAYDTAKTSDPKLLAFASVQIDHLHGYAKDSCPDASQRSQCYEKALAQLTPLKGDRFAISSYPFLQGTRAADLPTDWFERAAKRLGKVPLIAETGWLSTEIRAQLGAACQTPVQSTPEEALAYLDTVLDAAERGQLELVTWWSDRDLLPAGLMTNCPCTFGSTWCSVVNLFRSAGGSDPQAAFFGELGLKAFGTMGLRDYDGNPKPLMDHWQRFRR